MKLTIRNVSAKLVHMYEIAQKNPAIKKPLSWALYQTWKWCNVIEKEREDQT